MKNIIFILFVIISTNLNAQVQLPIINLDSISADSIYKINNANGLTIYDIQLKYNNIQIYRNNQFQIITNIYNLDDTLNISKNLRLITSTFMKSNVALINSNIFQIPYKENYMIDDNILLQNNRLYKFIFYTSRESQIPLVVFFRL